MLQFSKGSPCGAMGTSEAPLVQHALLCVCLSVTERVTYTHTHTHTLGAQDVESKKQTEREWKEGRLHCFS